MAMAQDTGTAPAIDLTDEQLAHYRSRATEPNRSDQWRRAIALSYMSARSAHTDPDGGPVYFPIAGAAYPGCVR